MSRIRKQFSQLEEPRIGRNKLHRPMDRAIPVIGPVIGGADGWEAIEEPAKEQLKWVRRFASFANGVPSHD